MRWEFSGGSIDFDPEHIPVVITTLRGRMQPAPFDEYLRTSWTHMKDRRVVLVVDATKAEMMDSVVRRLQADWLARHTFEVRQRTIAVVFALPTAFQRGVLTAIHWTNRPVYPYEIVAARDAALDAARRLAEKDGQSVPSSLSRAYPGVGAEPRA